MKDDGSYEVGYGRPPKKNQWKAGQSGNPRGRAGHRRKQTVDVIERLRRAVQQMIPVTRDGRQTSAPYTEVLIESILIDALRAPVGQRMKLLNELIERGVMSPTMGDLMPTQKAAEEFVRKLAEGAENSRTNHEFGPQT